MTIPNVPRFNVPETFGRALSYEGQIHAILGWYDENADAINDVMPQINEAVEKIDTIDDKIDAAEAATEAANTATSAANTATAAANTATAAANTAASGAQSARVVANEAATRANDAAAAIESYPSVVAEKLVYPGTAEVTDFMLPESVDTETVAGVTPTYKGGSTLHMSGTAGSTSSPTFQIASSNTIGLEAGRRYLCHLEVSGSTSGFDPHVSWTVTAQPSGAAVAVDVAEGDSRYGDVYFVWPEGSFTGYFVDYKVFGPYTYDNDVTLHIVDVESDAVLGNGHSSAKLTGVPWESDSVKVGGGTVTVSPVTYMLPDVGTEVIANGSIPSHTGTGPFPVHTFKMPVPWDTFKRGRSYHFAVVDPTVRQLSTFRWDVWVEGVTIDGSTETATELTDRYTINTANRYAHFDLTNTGQFPVDGYSRFDVVYDLSIETTSATVFEDTPLPRVMWTINGVQDNIELSDRIDDIAAGSVSDYSLTANKYATGSVTSRAIQDGAATTDKIADGAVTDAKLASDGVKGVVSTLQTKSMIQRDVNLDGADLTSATVNPGVYSSRKKADSTGYPDDMVTGHYCIVVYFNVNNAYRYFYVIDTTNSDMWVYDSTEYAKIVTDEQLESALLVPGRNDDIRDVIADTYRPYGSSVVQTTDTNRRIIAADGTITQVSDTVGNRLYYVTDPISVAPGDKLVISLWMRYNNQVAAFYDSGGACVGTVGSNMGIDQGSNLHQFIDYTLIVPESAVSVVIGYHATYAHSIEVFGGYKILDKQLAGKKWACIGDSLTDPVTTRASKKYYDYIVEDTGVAFVNLGASGTGYAKTHNDNGTFRSRIANVPDDTDVLTFFGSGNDLSAGLPIGSASDTTDDTVLGCVKNTILEVFSSKPNVRLGIIAPTPWDDYPPYTSGNNMETLVNGMKTISEMYSIPFLDLYHCSNLRPWDATFRQTYYSKDDGNGVHPDENGNKRFAPMILSFLQDIVSW